MDIRISKQPSPGVGTLMYVGDGTDAPPMPSQVAMGAGVVGALMALLCGAPVVKIAGAAVAGFVGYGVYQAKR